MKGRNTGGLLQRQPTLQEFPIRAASCACNTFDGNDHVTAAARSWTAASVEAVAPLRTEERDPAARAFRHRSSSACTR